LETIPEYVQDSNATAGVNLAVPAQTLRPRQQLPAKGSCWYCEKPLDSVRRFCGKECAGSFDEEAEYTR
jgi:hypothetical protein